MKDVETGTGTSAVGMRSRGADCTRRTPQINSRADGQGGTPFHELGQRQREALETWGRHRFGHAFDYLTQSEARHLTYSPNVDTIRDRLAAAVREGGFRRRWRSPRKEKP